MGMLWTACEPITLSHEGEIDFTQYRSVYVEPISLSGDSVFPDLDTSTQLYLVQELRDIAGFTSVNSTIGARSDTTLVVDMTVNSRENFETGEITYEAKTRYTLLENVTGRRLFEDTTSATDSDIVEAQEDALDDIALAFLRPYRI
jgi:hypothetical protein